MKDNNSQIRRLSSFFILLTLIFCLIKIDSNLFVEADVTLTDNTPSTGTTGENFTFTFGVVGNDNNATVEYWFGSDASQNVSMDMSSNVYSKTIRIPMNSTNTLHYIFHLNDTNGNWITTLQKNVTITDNNGPVFGTDGSDTSGTTGEIFRFSINVTDNFGISNVTVEYWFGLGNHTNVSMSGSGPYTHQISIPSNSTFTLHYIFHPIGNSN